MSYLTLSGAASHVSRRSESTEFRVGRQPVWIMDTPYLVDGDLVSAVGSEKNGTFRALVMRNDTTGLVSHRRLPSDLVEGAMPAMILGGLALLLVVIFPPILLLLFPVMLPGAGFLLFVRHRRREVERAKEVLSQMPVPQGSAA